MRTLRPREFTELVQAHRARKSQATRGFEPIESLSDTWVLNSRAPPPVSQVLGALSVLRGQWSHRPARGSLQGNAVLRPWGFQAHGHRMEKQSADSDTESSTTPPTHPPNVSNAGWWLRTMVQGLGSNLLRVTDTCPKTRILKLSTTYLHLGPEHSLRGWPVHCRTLNSIPDLHPIAHIRLNPHKPP